MNEVLWDSPLILLLYRLVTFYFFLHLSWSTLGIFGPLASVSSGSSSKPKSVHFLTFNAVPTLHYTVQDTGKTGATQELQQFKGFASFNLRFIQNFSAFLAHLPDFFQGMFFNTLIPRLPFWLRWMPLPLVWAQCYCKWMKLNLIFIRLPSFQGISFQLKETMTLRTMSSEVVVAWRFSPSIHGDHWQQKTPISWACPSIFHLCLPHPVGPGWKNCPSCPSGACSSGMSLKPGLCSNFRNIPCFCQSEKDWNSAHVHLQQFVCCHRSQADVRGHLYSTTSPSRMSGSQPSTSDYSSDYSCALPRHPPNKPSPLRIRFILYSMSDSSNHFTHLILRPQNQAWLWVPSSFANWWKSLVCCQVHTYTQGHLKWLGRV